LVFENALATVSIERMDRLKDGWNRVVPEVSAADLNAIRLCVVNALQLKNTVLEIQTAAAEAIATAASSAATPSAAPAPASPVAASQAGKDGPA
jgi:hypothetical protein